MASLDTLADARNFQPCKSKNDRPSFVDEKRMHDIKKNGIPNIPSLFIDENCNKKEIPNKHKMDEFNNFWMMFCNAIHMWLYHSNDCHYFRLFESLKKKGD